VNGDPPTSAHSHSLRPLRLVAAWLRDDPACPRSARCWFTAATFGAFVALVVLGAAHHQVWRDEARALSIALEPDSVFGLGEALANEGHPGLWHLLLRLAHGLVATPHVLQIVTIPIGIAAAALLFFGAPLPTWWRVLFLFGWVPLFEGPVLCRNYGIAMLLLFWFCASVTARPLRPVAAAIALALLANTNAYGTMMTGVLALFLVTEARRQRLSPRVLALLVVVVAAGTVIAFATMLPTPASKLVPSIGDKFENIGMTALGAVRRFSTTTNTLFGFAPLAWGVVLLFAVATLAVPHLALAVVLMFAGAAWFMRGIYGAGPHHLGMLFAFMVAVTWLRAGHATATTAGPRVVRGAWRVLLFGVWPLLLLLQDYRGLREIQQEVEYTKTAAPELARLLARADLAGAVVIGEPDYFLDALPYYRDNPIFIAREERFGRRVSWTTANRRDSDLGQLLATARRVHREQAAPVLLVIGKAIALDRPSGEVRHGYGDWFRWSTAQHQEFVVATELVASLPARPSRFRGDEHYDVYRLRE
jgi:hypothetical protein